MGACTRSTASVHDPSVFYDEASATYYAFGSHFAVATSKDLVSWSQVSRDNEAQNLYGTPDWKSVLTASVPVVNPSADIVSTWAPDVEYYNGKYYMYYSLTRAFGSSASAIGRVSADSVMGPYSGDRVILSSVNGGGPNCIDPELFYDKDGKWIHGMEACPVSGTLTELAAPAKKGDRIIKLKDASKWQKRPSNIAFHAKADESDLPNRDLSPYVTSVEQMDGVWEVTLRTALRKSYEAGTLCRQQSGSPFHYIRLGANLKDEWSTFSAVIPPSAIWRGAASMKIVCFSNPGKPASICMKSVGIRELPLK